MQNPFRATICTVAALFAFLPALFAQSGAGAQPDISGVWLRTRDSDQFGKDLPPMTPAGKRLFDENRRGQVPGLDEGLDELDPSIYCLPHGTPRAWTLNYPFEIIQLPGRVLVMHESTQMNRRIYLDGRKMPENYPHTYMGFSSGRYVGDSLVIGTTGLDEATWLDARGIPHSSALKLTERIRRAGPSTLEGDFQFDDPNTFTRPWSQKLTFALQPAMEIMEHIGYCEDRFRYNYSERIFRGTVDWQSPEQAAGRDR